MKKLCIAGLAVFAPLAFASRPVDERKPAAPDGTVEISAVVGKVTVIGWDNAEIHIEGTIGDDVEKLEFEVSGSGADIEVVLPDGRGRKRNIDAEAKLTIHVPKGSSVNVETVSAPIRVENVIGAKIDAESVSGAVTIVGAAGEVHAETVSASIEVSGSPTVVDTECVSGQTTIRGATRKVKASGTSGGVDIEAGILEECETEFISGRVNFTGGIADGGNLSLDNFSGSVTVNLTNDVFGSYEISTFSGGIKCDFGPAPKKASKFTPGMELNFEHGSGNASVGIETFSGSVTIRRK